MSIIHRVLDRNIHLLQPNQPLNGRGAKELELKFQQAQSQGARRVIVDLADVSFVDCSGLAALVAGYRLFGRNHKQNFQLVALQDQPKLLLELTMFNRIFAVADSVAEAMGAQSSRQPQLHQPAPALVSPLVETGVL
ncbi:MAG: STAS domain-containing protein [Anaerolineae bacterium]|nr:STAS domain-containing protein [Anaerolineae bacterium]